MVRTLSALSLVVICAAAVDAATVTGVISDSTGGAIPQRARGPAGDCDRATAGDVG